MTMPLEQDVLMFIHIYEQHSILSHSMCHSEHLF